MNEFEIIKLMNETTIAYLKKKKQPSDKNEKIQQLLEQDEACFFKFEKTKALKVLQEIGIAKEIIEDEYKELTSQKEFYRLKEKGIRINDSFIVKYNMDYNKDIFKENNTHPANEKKALVEIKEKWYQKLIAAFIKFLK